MSLTTTVTSISQSMIISISVVCSLPLALVTHIIYLSKPLYKVWELVDYHWHWRCSQQPWRSSQESQPCAYQTSQCLPRCLLARLVDLYALSWLVTISAIYNLSRETSNDVFTKIASLCVLDRCVRAAVFKVYIWCRNSMVWGVNTPVNWSRVAITQSRSNYNLARTTHNEDTELVSTFSA